MNTGVELLLKRMKDCPEDFYPEYSKPMTRWARLVDHAVGDELLTEEEHDALMAGLKEVRRTRFTEMVMKELAGVEDEVGDGLSLNSMSHAQAYQKHQNEQLRLHLDAHRQALEDVDSLSEKQKKNMLERILEMKKAGIK